MPDQASGKMIERKIPMKDVDVINKWAKGAQARRNVKKMIASHAIATLKYPSYDGEQLVDTQEALMTDKEADDLIDPKHGMFWNNNKVDIGKGKKYQGQWKEKVW